MHTKQIVQTQSSPQMLMLTSNYGTHRPKPIKNRLNNSNHITLNTNTQHVDHPIKHNSLLYQTSLL